MFTLLLELNVVCEQRWIQFELQNSLSRSFATDGKICTVVSQICTVIFAKYALSFSKKITSQLKFFLCSE